MSALESTELPPEPVDISVLISLAEAHEDGEPDLVVELKIGRASCRERV